MSKIKSLLKELDERASDIQSAKDKMAELKKAEMELY